MIFIIHRFWEYFREPFRELGNLNMLVGPSDEHVGRACWSSLFREPFRGPLGAFPGTFRFPVLGSI